MNVLIVGLGSMGKRRARLLRGLLPDARVCGVDLSPERQAQAKELGITPYASIAEAAKAEKFDAAAARAMIEAGAERLGTSRSIAICREAAEKEI